MNLIRTLFLFGLLLLCCQFSYGQTAKVQVIHNASTETVNVVANGDVLLPNLIYRTATTYVDMPAGVPLTIDLMTANPWATNPSYTDVAVVEFEENKSYIMMLYGTFVDSDPNGVEITVTESVGTTSAPGFLDLQFFHGAQNFPPVGIESNGNPWFDLTPYGSFAEDWTRIPAADYLIDVTIGGPPTGLPPYIANLEFLSGATAVGYAVGNPGFPPEPWVALSSGGTFPLKFFIPTAKVQVIHNASTETVNVAGNGQLLLSDLHYRTATTYVDLPAGVPLNIDLIPTNPWTTSPTYNDIGTVLFEPNKSYIMMLYGTFVDTDPNGVEVAVTESVGTTSAPGFIDLQFFHGAQNFPPVGIESDGNTWFDLTPYGSFADDWTRIPADDFLIDVTVDGPPTGLPPYGANLKFWDGGTAVGFAVGNPGFPPEPWVALSTGGTFPLNFSPQNREAHDGLSNTTLLADFVQLSPNPAREETLIQMSLTEESKTTLKLYNTNGQLLELIDKGLLSAGQHQHLLNTAKLPDGTYYIQVQQNARVETLPLVVIK